MLWPLVVFQEVGGATLSGDSDNFVPQVLVLPVANRWPSLLLPANTVTTPRVALPLGRFNLVLPS